VRLVEYTPDSFSSLREQAERLRVPSLCHRPFVDYYYTGNPWCQLYLLTAEDDSIAGTIGIDQMQFAAGDRVLNLAFATSYHAAQTGAGGYLYLHWMKTADFGLAFGGSADTHRILRQQRWTYFPGVKTLVLNYSYPARPGEPSWRRFAKRVYAALRRQRIDRLARHIPADVLSRISVQEETDFTEDMLPRGSLFSFRFAPPLEYLRWRYHTGLSFVRYRLFRVCSEGRTSGYVVLNDQPGKIIVAQCDGEAPVTLAYGVLRSLVAATKEDDRIREVMLTSSHPDMQKVYQRFGFRLRGDDRPFVIGSRRHPVDLPGDTTRWLVNFDWGDNGLRAPFLDQRRVRPAGRNRSADEPVSFARLPAGETG
jgi:hypothetical protein